MKATELKRGQIVSFQDELYSVLSVRQVRPAARPAFYQVELKNLKRGGVMQHRFNEDAVIDGVFVQRRRVQYLYKDGANYVFMDLETYEQYLLPGEQVEEFAPYMPFNCEATLATTEKGEPLFIELPAATVIEVVDTPPGARGDTVTNVQKPARLETGLEIKVPLHIKTGDKVKIDTRTGQFIERA